MSEPIFLGELTRDEVKEIAPKATLILPTASTEQHGPHLPLMTDSIIGTAVASGAARLASLEVPVVLAPTLIYGNSQHHLVFSALSLQSQTYADVIGDLVNCALKAGFRRLFFVNSHGGNEDTIRVVARDMILDHKATIGVCSYWTVAKAALSSAGIDPSWALPGHSGGFETSLMMALQPHLVRLDKMPRDTAHPNGIGYRRVADGLLVVQGGDWERIGGYSDAPINASAEVGNRLLEIACAEVSRAIIAFHRVA